VNLNLLLQATAEAGTAGSASKIAGIVSVVVIVLGQLLKSPLLGEVLRRVPPVRRGWVIAGVAGVAAGLAAWQQGLPLDGIVSTVVTAMSGAIAGHQLLVRPLEDRGAALPAAPVDPQLPPD